jgi:hypothetical protein
METVTFRQTSDLPHIELPMASPSMDTCSRRGRVGNVLRLWQRSPYASLFVCRRVFRNRDFFSCGVLLVVGVEHCSPFQTASAAGSRGCFCFQSHHGYGCRPAESFDATCRIRTGFGAVVAWTRLRSCDAMLLTVMPVLATFRLFETTSPSIDKVRYVLRAAGAMAPAYL